MKTTQLTPTRILVEFPSVKEMTLTMFRISEFFESDSDDLLGKKFTFDEFVDGLTNESGEWIKFPGGETYFAFWDGFNVPKEKLDGFFQLYGEEISNRERAILEIAKNLPANGYLITCEEGDEMTLKHENAHGLFFENEAYRNEAISIVDSMPSNIRDKFIGDLKEMKYNDEVLTDEMHAYLIAYDPEEWDDCFSSLKESEITDYRDKLQQIYNQYK